MKRLLLLASLFSASVQAGEPAASIVQRWDYTPWITPGKPFVVAFDLKGDPGAKAVQLRYATAQGKTETVRCDANSANRLSYSVTLGPFKTPTAEKLTFWIDDGAATTPEKQSASFSTVQEIEISGHTGDKLVYALKDCGADILFTPCCYIPSAWVSCEVIPVLPSGFANGLPKSLLSPFISMSMDDMVKATGGLQLRMKIDRKQWASIKPDTIKAYIRNDGVWHAILEPLIDLERRTITFFFAYGGYCIVAAEPKA